MKVKLQSLKKFATNVTDKANKEQEEKFLAGNGFDHKAKLIDRSKERDLDVVELAKATQKGDSKL